MEKGPKKKAISFQINEKTGISCDYFNAFSLVEYSIKSPEQWKKWWDKEEIKQTIKDRGNKVVLRYEDRFPPDLFDYSALTQQQKKDAERLSEIADEINEAYMSGNFNRKDYARLFVEAVGLIYGKDGQAHTVRREFFEKEFGTKDKKEELKD